MNKKINWLNESFYSEPLSPACRMCADGSKMVVLITGLCPADCYYCPLSLEKIGKDRIFADEWELSNEEDVEKLLKEARYIKATGAGITGGDPLIVWQRAKNYIKFLKKNFGQKFHVHLYTSGIKNTEHIEELIDAGLDEIRFHPMPKNWIDMEKSPISDIIKKIVKIGCDVAIEIPAIPDMENETFSMIKWADNIGIKWINLNELEYSETNADKLNKKGYTVKDDLSSAVKGSQETAIKIFKMCSKHNFKAGVHYCSSSFKDGIQLRNRIKRRAKNVAKDFEIITDEGTLIKGILYAKTSLYELYKSIKKEFCIGDNLIFLDKNRIEIAPWILEEIAPKLAKRGIECFIVEEYPTADRLEVERIPFPQ